jgi:superfamily II DNA/RNA helicase
LTFSFVLGSQKTMYNKTNTSSRGRVSSERRPNSFNRNTSSARNGSARPVTEAKKFRSPELVADLYPVKFSRGGGTRSGSSFGGSSRGGFGGRRSGGRGRKMGDQIDISKFINRAETVVEEVYTPTHTFADFKVHARLKEAITARGYIVPSPIQDQAVPLAIEGRDIIGLANTGTGKTAAFLIPVINNILKDRKHQAIIITPTRELAIQIQREAIALIKGLGIFAVQCVGGTPIRFQIQDLAKRYNIVIGTPGRLKDLFDKKKLPLDKVSTVVLDEADRMLDMGFIDDVRYFLQHIPEKRQMLLFSATMPPAIEKLVSEFLQNPVKISVKSRDTSKNVDQDVVRVPDKSKKLDILCGLLQDPGFSKVLIFVETKRSVDHLQEELKARKFQAEAIHGDKEHRQRQQALRAFSSDKAQILIATDVAARGLDISGVTHVINYEIPQTYDTYVHRIGRTGRANQKGTALTFI